MLHSQKTEVEYSEEKRKSNNYFPKSSFYIDAILSNTTNQSCLDNEKLKKQLNLFTSLKNKSFHDFLNKINKQSKTTENAKNLYRRNEKFESNLMLPTKNVNFLLDINNPCNCTTWELLKKIEINHEIDIETNSNNQTIDLLKKPHFNMLREVSECNTVINSIKTLPSDNENFTESSMDDEKIDSSFGQKIKWKADSNIFSYSQNFITCPKTAPCSSMGPSAFHSVDKERQSKKSDIYNSHLQINSFRLEWLTQARMLHPNLIKDAISK